MLEINLVTSMLFRNFEIKSIRSPAATDVEELLSFTMGAVKTLGYAGGPTLATTTSANHIVCQR